MQPRARTPCNLGQNNIEPLHKKHELRIYNITRGPPKKKERPIPFQGGRTTLNREQDVTRKCHRTNNVGLVVGTGVRFGKIDPRIVVPQTRNKVGPPMYCIHYSYFLRFLVTLVRTLRHTRFALARFPAYRTA